jgi:type I restriction enzyme M protein
MLQNNSALKSKIDQLWNKFWSGGISNPLTAIEQITYLLFMKRLDDLDTKKKGDAEFTGEKYISKFEGYWIPPENRIKLDENKPIAAAKKEKEEKEEPFRIEKETLRWSHFKQMAAEEMLLHVQTKVFPFLKELNGYESSFTHHMKKCCFHYSQTFIAGRSYCYHRRYFY